MNWLALRRETRRRARAAHIAELERDTGFAPSVDAQGLPHVVVVRNPTGDWLMGDRWVSYGLERHLGLFGEVCAWTKRGCIREARRRIRAIVERDLVGKVEVKV